MQLDDYLARHPKTHLIFDWDGTIARMEMDWSQWRQNMATVLSQFDPNFTQHWNFYSYQDSNNFIREYGEKVAELIKKVTSDYEQNYSYGITPNTELVRFVKQADDYHKYLYSSNSRQAVFKGLTELGLVDYFKQVITRDEVMLAKPDPEGFYLIYDPSVDKSEYLMIGNSHNDEGMAQTVGIDCFLVDF